jgi:hypothetical protein
VEIPDFIKDATNVYRTKMYVVRQIVALEYDEKEGVNFCSYDTYFRRTAERDAEYEKIFKARRRLNGKRLPAGLRTHDHVR